MATSADDDSNPLMEDATPQERLFHFAMKGDANAINDLLKSNTNVNLKARNELGLTPLQLTVEYEHLPATTNPTKERVQGPKVCHS